MVTPPGVAVVAYQGLGEIGAATMGAAAAGAEYARYHVDFKLADRPEQPVSGTTVVLITGYTVFEDIRKIIGIRASGGAANVDIITLRKIAFGGE